MCIHIFYFLLCGLGSVLGFMALCYGVHLIFFGYGTGPTIHSYTSNESLEDRLEGRINW